MLILDTDIVTLLHAGNPSIMRRVEQTRESESIAITIVTRIEVLRGRFDYLLKAATTEQFLKAQRLLVYSEGRLDESPMLFLDQAALKQFAILQGTKGARNIGRSDLLIAAIALAHDAALATRNAKHFSKVPMLRLANWKD
jgi:tRNA(fMet)-specific endonuclease VapC